MHYTQTLERIFKTLKKKLTAQSRPDDVPPVINNMPTPLVLEYDYCKRIDVPNALAKKLKENENAEWGEPWSWYVKWATLHYCDGDKEEHKIDALEDDGPDCKRDNGQNWDDEEESDDE